MSTVEAPAISTPKSAPKRRAQRPMQAKYPCSMNFGITLAMFEAVQELCMAESPFTQSEVARHALHSYLLTNSERYRRVFRAGGSTGHA